MSEDSSATQEYELLRTSVRAEREVVHVSHVSVGARMLLAMIVVAANHMSITIAPQCLQPYLRPVWL